VFENFWTLDIFFLLQLDFLNNDSFSNFQISISDFIKNDAKEILSTGNEI